LDATKKTELTVALSGNPNCGKSSLFNILTGLSQKITNIPGTTIECKLGFATINGKRYRIIDTPGTYSIDAKSEDEAAATGIYKSGSKLEPDLIVYIADATNLKRNLLYFSQLSDLNKPMLLVLNMVDVANFKGIEVDVERLERELGIKVITTNARVGDGVKELKEAIPISTFKSHYPFLSDEADVEPLVMRYQQINKLLERVVTRKSQRELITAKLDPILTHPVWGYLIFLLVLLVIFQSVFKLAEWPMEQIELGFDWMGKQVFNNLPESWIRSLIVNGLLAGLAGVIVFIPQIAILFVFMSILEDTGYLARVSFIMDKILRGLGLSGKSVVPLLSGAACAIPAIMATRNIENWKDRIITIMVTPLMSCSARLPVYTLLISLAVPNTYILGIFSLKGLVLLIMYVIGTMASLIAAVIFKIFIKQKSLNYFIMELPMYHPPRWKNVGLMVWIKSKSFVTEAGKVILVVSVILWFLASYGPPKGVDTGYVPIETENLDESYAGHFGKTIEPVIKPLGFNWKIGIALLTSFAAREVFVGTMSTIYSVDDGENLTLLRDKLRNEKDPETGEPVYSLVVVFSLMIFYAFAMQCVSTLAVVYKETKSLKWPIIQFVYMTALAYVSSLFVYQVFS
jgi:ferrous iron transport protein B